MRSESAGRSAERLMSAEPFTVPFEECVHERRVCSTSDTVIRHFENFGFERFKHKDRGYRGEAKTRKETFR